MSGYREDAVRETAQLVHGGLDGETKRVAARMGRSTRTVTRWRNEGKGSPAYRVLHGQIDEDVIRYVQTCSDPWVFAAFAQSVASSRTIENEDDRELEEGYYLAAVQNAKDEGADNAARLDPRIRPAQRAILHLNDGAREMEMAARCQEMAARRLNWRVPLGGGR